MLYLATLQNVSIFTKWGNKLLQLNTCQTWKLCQNWKSSHTLFAVVLHMFWFYLVEFCLKMCSQVFQCAKYCTKIVSLKPQCGGHHLPGLFPTGMCKLLCLVDIRHCTTKDTLAPVKKVKQQLIYIDVVLQYWTANWIHDSWLLSQINRLVPVTIIASLFSETTVHD